MSRSDQLIFGWDLGGAHVKLAILDSQGHLLSVAQRPCELWMGLDRLEAAVAELGHGEMRDSVHAVTMTGELVDLFPDRVGGVAAIVDTFQQRAGVSGAWLFTGAGFVPASEAAARWADIASANWLATAKVVADLRLQALVIDIGSTTTDIVVVSSGEVRSQGRDDHARLARDELVYTGVVRTPLMALAPRVPFGGEWVGLMTEHFATAGDLYRISGELDPAFDQARTADGRGRSREESMRRLARMVGCDLEQASPQAWERLARWLAHAQQQLVRQACDRQLSRGLLGSNAPVVGLGVGRFLAARVAGELGLEFRAFSELAGVVPAHRAAVDVCGPAFAVARLLHAGALAHRPTGGR